jgi:uncharacterized damage-inducible protein DinB
MSAEQARRLIAYNEWANEKILSAIDGMSDAELRQPVDAYVGSIDNNLRHALGAQIVWLRRWNGEPAVTDPKIEDLHQAYAASHADLRAFAASLADTDCARTIAYRDSRGESHALPLGLLISHLVNHGTHHRGETGMLLERVGRSPGDMDYLYFEYEQTGQRG